jgi:hypothetical protein
MENIMGKVMKMPRDYMLRTISGHMVKFEANVARDVPVDCVEAAIAVGAVFDDGAAFIPSEKREAGVEPKYGFEREEDIFKACETIIEKASPDDFTASSAPKLDAVNRELGYSVERREVNKVWRKLQEARANAA